jgi:hypothetical protein
MTVPEVVVIAVVAAGIVVLATAALADAIVLLRGARALATAARHRSTTDDEAAMASPLTPALSVVVPWCGADPVERLATLRSARYPDLQIIVVSTEAAATSELTDEFGLVEVPMVLPADLPSGTAVARALVPRDGTPLVVVETTGRRDEADLLNIGVGLARARGVVVLHRGVLLADDSLLRISRPFRDRPRSIYAASAVARGLADGIVEHERVVGRRWPTTWGGRFDMVRRLRRAVLPHAAGLGHDALARPGGLLLIRRDHLEEVGGYRPEAGGTDADLLVRVERMPRAVDAPARVVAPSPAPICWRAAQGEEATPARRVGTSAAWFLPVLAGSLVVAALGLVFGVVGAGPVLLVAVVGMLVPATMSLAALTADELTFPRTGPLGDLGAAAVAALVEPFRLARR